MSRVVAFAALLAAFGPALAESNEESLKQARAELKKGELEAAMKSVL